MQNQRSHHTPRWINIVVLAVLLIAIWMDWLWIWGILFIYWAVPSLLTGETHLVGSVPREEQPVIFWLVTALWIGLGVLAILWDLAPATFETVLGG